MRAKDEQCKEKEATRERTRKIVGNKTKVGDGLGVERERRIRKEVLERRNEKRRAVKQREMEEACGMTEDGGDEKKTAEEGEKATRYGGEE